jgi:hypothetical protein
MSPSSDGTNAMMLLYAPALGKKAYHPRLFKSSTYFSGLPQTRRYEAATLVRLSLSSSAAHSLSDPDVVGWHWSALKSLVPTCRTS